MTARGTPIIPCIVGDSLKTLRLSTALLRRGINVNPILYPAVPEELARLRFFVTSCHSEEQIRYAVKALAEELERCCASRWRDGVNALANANAYVRAPARPAALRMFCFHHAGGGASLYRGWQRARRPARRGVPGAAART